MPNRTVRASLVFLNNLLYQLVAAFVALAITPLIVLNLGTDAFGAWKIIDKTTKFLTLGNFRPQGLLKLTLAKDIGNNDCDYKQQQVGAATSILLLTLPIVFILSFLLFHFRDFFIPVSKEIHHQVGLALLIMIFYRVVSPFLDISGYTLAGLNMQYKLFGIQSIAVVISALLQYAVVSQGYTLPWIAAVESFTAISIAIVNYIILIKNVLWFKLIYPPRQLIQSYFKTNLLALLTELFRYVSSFSDLILIGIYFDAAITAVYSLTRTLTIFLFMPANSIVQSVLAGMGDLVGRKDFKKLLELRSEQMNLMIFISFIVGIIAMLFNAAFVGLWVGVNHFGGESLSRWIIAATIFDVLVKIEANYFDASLKLKYQSLALGWMSIIYLVIIVLCEPILGLNVFPIAQIGSLVILMILYWVGLRDFLQSSLTNVVGTVFRPLCISVVLFYLASWFTPPVIHTWLELFIETSKAVILAGIIGWFLILRKNDRKKLMVRGLSICGYFYHR